MVVPSTLQGLPSSHSPRDLSIKIYSLSPFEPYAQPILASYISFPTNTYQATRINNDISRYMVILSCPLTSPICHVQAFNTNIRAFIFPHGVKKYINEHLVTKSSKFMFSLSRRYKITHLYISLPFLESKQDIIFLKND